MLVVMRPTQVRRADGRVVTLMPGVKDGRVLERMRSALPIETVKRLQAKGRLVEDTPPW